MGHQKPRSCTPLALLERRGALKGVRRKTGQAAGPSHGKTWTGVCIAAVPAPAADTTNPLNHVSPCTGFAALLGIILGLSIGAFRLLSHFRESWVL
jgi:hypothetical protein